MLTDPGDLVVDIFGGSNTTGWVAEVEKRRWLAFDESRDYVAASAFRFLKKGTDVEAMRELYGMLRSGDAVDLTRLRHFGTLLETANSDHEKQRSRARSAPEHGKLFL